MMSEMYEMRQKFLDACLEIIHKSFKGHAFDVFQFKPFIMGATGLKGSGHKKAENEYETMASDILDCLVDRGNLTTRRVKVFKVYQIKDKQ